MATTMKLNGATLAQCSSFSVRIEWLGSAVGLANGGLRRDLVNANLKRRWSLSWVALTVSEAITIIENWADAVAGDVKFIPPDYTITDPETDLGYDVNAGQNPQSTFEAYQVAGGSLRYRASIELWEA